MIYVVAAEVVLIVVLTIIGVYKSRKYAELKEFHKDYRKQREAEIKGLIEDLTAARNAANMTVCAQPDYMKADFDYAAEPMSSQLRRIAAVVDSWETQRKNTEAEMAALKKKADAIDIIRGIS